MSNEPGVSSPVLVGLCDDCGHRTFPPPAFCPECLGEHVAPVHSSSQGAVYAATVVRHGPKGVDLPYGLAYVDLEPGVRVMARFDATNDLLVPEQQVIVQQTAVAGAAPRIVAQPLTHEGTTR